MALICVDAQFPVSLCRYLTEHGFQATHVSIELGWQARDADIWTWALANGATILTKDDDFGIRARAARTAPAVLLVRVGNTSNSDLRRWLLPRIGDALARTADGERLVVLESQN